MTKKLYRSTEHKILAGVLGGVAEYFDIDPVLPRLMFTLITFATGIAPAVIVYIIAWIVVPLTATPTKEEQKEPIHVVIHEVKKEDANDKRAI
jgi:phage shock protein C